VALDPLFRAVTSQGQKWRGILFNVLRTAAAVCTVQFTLDPKENLLSGSLQYSSLKILREERTTILKVVEVKSRGLF